MIFYSVAYFFTKMSIGTHIGKGTTFISSLKDYFTEEKLALEDGPPPCQIFTGSPKTWARSEITTKDLEQTVSFVKEHSLRVYVHSVYFINL
jgi:endonuclease IV